ncbi:hypothetical protein LUZ61_012094 [Rhynchospora tenuis]|uniref:Uncharacterized protein n=1 Tax=Rhynchospora tenuis TaxID=198213 RepID=A0AAD6A2F6_9POAL|nr:hypothetical protein LUZ61_012094 [Rhynchospora tenuis]
MAESVVSFVLGKLGDAFVKEVLHLYGVSGQVEKVSHELIRIQAFLEDADRKHLNKRQEQWVKEVRDLAYRIEDAIDTFLLTVQEKKPGKREAVKRLFMKAKELPAVHMLGNEIKEIEARFQEIEASRVRYGINNLGEGLDGQIGQPVKKIVLPDVEEEGIVGLEADRDKILSLLLDEKDKRRSVISIVGPGGLGKTTLARKVYNSKAVEEQFAIRIWVVVSQNFNSIDILRNIADELKIEPPGDHKDYNRLTNLHSDTNETIPDDLYGIGEQLTRKCGGLPLALRVLGGLLSTKPTASWHTEIEKMDWGSDGKECGAIIDTSYDDLPFALKSCFMYFAAFPEDYTINAKPLLQMWVAEGFIPQQDNKTIEDTAEMFLEDLVQRYFIKKFINH